MIESSSNPQIKYLHRLGKSSRFRKAENVFLAEGFKMIKEALLHKLAVKLYVTEAARKSDRKEYLEIFRLAQETGIYVETVSEKVFQSICDTMNPQGVLAIVKMPAYELESYLSEQVRFLCLEDINDPGNLGTMMRTAEGAGMTGVIMSKRTVDLFNPKVVRATMGSLFRVPFFYSDCLEETIGLLKSKGVTIYGAHLQGSVPYDKVSYNGSVCLMIGNEANGLSESVTMLADTCIRIPMEGQLESLNAAVSAALLMYEIKRREEV